MKRIVHFFVLLGLFWAPAAPSAWGRAAGPTFSGTFLQLWNAHAGWSGQQWQDLLASMRAIGVTEIVVQWSVDGIAPVHDDAQRVGPLRPALEKVLRAAHDQHMRVTLGLVHDREYWEKIKGDPEAVRRYFHQLCRVSLATAADVARLDPDRAALSGLYIPQEIDDQSWLEPARQAELLLFIPTACGDAGKGAIVSRGTMAPLSHAAPAVLLSLRLWVQNDPVVQDILHSC